MWKQNPNHTTCLPDVVQDGKIKSEMNTDNGSRPKLDVTSFKTILEGRRAGSLPSQSASQKPHSQQITEKISNDESGMEPRCKLSYSMSECKNRQDVYSLQKESLNIFDPLLGAILEPLRKVPCLVLPTLYSAPNSKKKKISNSKPDKDLTCVPKLKKKIISDFVPDLDLTSLDTEPEEQQDSTSFVTEPEQPKQSSIADTEPDEQHSPIPENNDMLRFTPRSQINEDITMINSSYKLRNEKSEQDKMKEAKEKLLLLQQVHFLKERIAFQKKAINDLKKKESILEEKLKDDYKIQQLLNDELDECEKHYNKARSDLVQKDRDLVQMPERLRNEKAARLLIISTLKEEKKELKSILTNIEKEFSAVLNAYEANKNTSKCYEIRIKNLENAISANKKIIEQWNKKIECLEDHANQKIQAARDQIDAQEMCNKMECLKQNALLKKHELKISSLESALRMQMLEHSNLTQMFHDLTKSQNLTPYTEVKMYDRSGSLL